MTTLSFSNTRTRKETAQREADAQTKTITPLEPLRAAIVPALAATAANLALYASAAALWDVPGGFDALNPFAVAIATVAGTFVAAAGLAILTRLLRRPVPVFVTAVAALTALSMAGPLQAMAGSMNGMPEANTATGLTMVAMHLVTGGVIAPMVPRGRVGNRTPAKRQPGERSNAMSPFTHEELEYLQGERRLGRLATVGTDGVPHVAPVGWSYNPDLGTIDIDGHDMAGTKKYRDVARTGHAAIVIDEVLPPWRPRGVEVRGRAEAIEGPPALIRLHPKRIVSWGLPGTGNGQRQARQVESGR